MKCFILLINPGSCPRTAARATASIAVKHRQVRMTACSRPLSLRHPSRSHFFVQDLETLERKLSALRRHCDDLGRDYDEIRKGVGVRVIVGRDDEEAESRLRMEAVALGTTVEYLRSLLGDAYGAPEKVASFLEEYVDKGVGLITPVFHYLDDIELFAEEVIPLLK